MTDHPPLDDADMLWIASRRLWALASSARAAAPSVNMEGDAMPLFIPAGYYEVAYEMSLQGSTHTSVCTQGLQYTGADFPTDVPAVATAWADNMMNPMADVWSFTGCRVRDASGTVFDEPQSTQGATAHTPTTPNVTFLLKKVTGLGGRKNRGRMYYPGCSEQDVDGVGTVIGSKITEINGQIGGWIGALALANFSPVILHNVTATDPTPAPTLMSTMFTETLAATQRRRMRP